MTIILSFLYPCMGGGSARLNPFLSEYEQLFSRMVVGQGQHGHGTSLHMYCMNSTPLPYHSPVL